jgi:hypothetical protein
MGSTYDRRRFLGSAAMTMAATQFGILGTAGAQSSQGKAPEVPPIPPGTNTSLGPLKQVDAGVFALRREHHAREHALARVRVCASRGRRRRRRDGDRRSDEMIPVRNCTGWRRSEDVVIAGMSVVRLRKEVNTEVGSRRSAGGRARGGLALALGHPPGGRRRW